MRPEQYQKLQAEIRGYLIGATSLAADACDRLAAGIAGIVDDRSERDEFAEIIERLKQRGVIPVTFDASNLDKTEEVSRG